MARNYFKNAQPKAPAPRPDTSDPYKNPILKHVPDCLAIDAFHHGLRVIPKAEGGQVDDNTRELHRVIIACLQKEGLTPNEHPPGNALHYSTPNDDLRTSAAKHSLMIYFDKPSGREEWEALTQQIDAALAKICEAAKTLKQSRKSGRALGEESN